MADLPLDAWTDQPAHLAEAAALPPLPLAGDDEPAAPAAVAVGEAPEPDARLYVESIAWKAAVKADDAPLRCHRHAPGQGYFHRIAAGEVYVHDNQASYCLTCALALGVVSRHRPQLASRGTRPGGGIGGISGA